MSKYNIYVFPADCHYGVMLSGLSSRESLEDYLQALIQLQESLKTIATLHRYNKKQPSFHPDYYQALHQQISQLSIYQKEVIERLNNFPPPRLF